MEMNESQTLKKYKKTLENPLQINEKKYVRIELKRASMRKGRIVSNE